MAGQINLLPEVLDLMLYAGDGMSLRFTCTNSAGAPVDLNGAVKAQVRLNRLNGAAPLAEFSVDTIDAYLGVVRISLTGDQTQDLLDTPDGPVAKFVGVWDLEWDSVDMEPRTLCQGKLECVADVTR